MRPLFVDFPHDEQAWTVDDAFLFGPDGPRARASRGGDRAVDERPRGPQPLDQGVVVDSVNVRVLL
jgi:hypothetical protein